VGHFSGTPCTLFTVSSHEVGLQHDTGAQSSVGRWLVNSQTVQRNRVWTVDRKHSVQVEFTAVPYANIAQTMNESQVSSHAWAWGISLPQVKPWPFNKSVNWLMEWDHPIWQ